jgi:hypothetical protein
MVAALEGDGKAGSACATLTQLLRPVEPSGLQEFHRCAGIVRRMHLPWETP